MGNMAPFSGFAGPQPVQPAHDPARRWPLHDVASTRRWEQQLLAGDLASKGVGHSPHELMGRAGLSAARWALALAPHARRITVLVGPGNNGGDGLVAARHLHQAHKEVHVVMPAGEAHNMVHDSANPSGQRPSDAAWALQQAQLAGVRITEGHALACDTDLVIDALLGLGSARAPSGALALAITASAASPGPVLAIDLPSGLHANSGQLLGQQAVRAHATLSMLTIKPGCFMAQGRDHAGAVWFDDLGVTCRQQLSAPALSAPAPTAWLGAAPLPTLRQHSSHKGTHGDVAVIGGAMGMQGAALLAARAALAAGAGRIYLSLLAWPGLDSDSVGVGVPCQLSAPELMLRPQWWHNAAAVLQASTVVCGCGGGAAVAAALPALLSHAGRLVLDADALNALAGDPTLARLLQGRASRGRTTVLTPHPLEAARLLDCSAAQVQQDRLAAAAELALRYAAVVVLKGSGTVIAHSGWPPTVNPSGNAALAGPGTGDVLAGWLGGLWAQQAADSDTPAVASSFAAAVAAAVSAAAVWRHGHAADLHAAAFPGTPLRATQLIEGMLAC